MQKLCIYAHAMIMVSFENSSCLENRGSCSRAMIAWVRERDLFLKRVAIASVGQEWLCELGTLNSDK